MAATSSLLVVDEKRQQREAVARTLREHDFKVFTAADLEQALSYLEEPVDLIISETRMGSNGGGFHLLKRWKERSPSTPFIMLTAPGDTESASRARQLGAEDSIGVPVDPEQLLALVHKCLDARRREEHVHRLAQPLNPSLDFEKIIGRSQVMLDVLDQTMRAAQSDSTVLLTGQSGTGKELIAEAVHRHSPRRGGPLVAINMAAVPENLVESELFGHVKGAYTGAAVSRIGRFEAAHSGTLFIDEVGDLALTSQAKLLRVLENHHVTPVGGNEERSVDVRVVAATNHPLEESVAEGEFREDLYYRLNVVMISLPPLRHRREDIPLLVHHFMEDICRANDKLPMELDPELVRFLEAYDWPGNVRQLRNCIESMVVLARAESLTTADLPATMRGAGYGYEPGFESLRGRTLEEIERMAVRQTLKRCGGNRTQAARSLGISVRTLQRKLKSWQSAGGMRHAI